MGPARCVSGRTLIRRFVTIDPTRREGPSSRGKQGNRVRAIHRGEGVTMARKSFLATLIGVAALAVPSAFADKGGIPHEGSNGQGRSADQTQTQAQAKTKTSGKALAKGHAKTHAQAKVKVQGQAKANGHAKAKGQAKVHTNGKALAKGHAKVNGQAKVHTNGKALAKGHAKTQTPTANIHAKAGKTTICHATGSATNPYVTITISNNALPAHRRHQDGRDIIPAPAEGGCSATVTGQVPQPAGGGQEQQQQQQGSTPGTTGSSTQGTAGANAQGTAGTGT